MTPLLPEDMAIMRAFAHPATALGLGHRQTELLVRVTRGLSRAELAFEMAVSVAAIDYHGRMIRRASGMSPRELAMQLLRSVVAAGCSESVAK